ncbi:hypothetical protein KKH39_02430 [Patescibacteria group bacterium]|nr:hypothetical protein [Patescibacteria group bacterium]
MFKKTNNWHISILVIIVSVLSISLVQKYVFAQWQEPNTLPGTSVSRNIVVSPMTSSLDLNGQTLTGEKVTIDSAGSTAINVKNSQICFDTTDCASAWPTGVDTDWTESGGNVYRTSGRVGVGTVSPAQLLHVSGGNILLDNNQSLKQLSSSGSEYSIIYLDSSDGLNLAGNDLKVKDLSGNSMLYIDDMGTVAYVGIGTDAPNKNLHIFSEGANSEIDIQSGSGLTHWGIYQDSATSDLNFWNTDNRVVFSDSGYVGIGVSIPAHQLHIESVDQNAVYAKTATVGKYAVYGENTADNGVGMYSLGDIAFMATSNRSGGMAILASKGSGAYAGYFDGTVKVTNGYFQFPVVSADPPDSDCGSVLDRGKAVFNSETGQLVICNFHKNVTPVWDRYESAASL